MISPVDAAANSGDRLVIGATFVVALAVALAVRGLDVLGLAALAVVFVPLEKLFALHRQRVFRRALFTDLTHILTNTMLAAAITIVLVVTAALPLLWMRALDVEAGLPESVSIAFAVVVALVGQYWGHRLTHEVPFLWRFHAVHHSIEHMDWIASGRLHPVDAAFTQTVVVLPLFLLGYDAGLFAGITASVTLLAVFQHANVRLRFPVVRWIVNTPEWHHWHHALDARAHDKNFGLPVVDWIFGTAFLPRGERPLGFGIPDPVPAEGYLRHVAYPFTRATAT